MIGSIRNNSVYKEMKDNDEDEDEYNERDSIAKGRNVGTYYPRRESKIVADQKVMRAISIIDDAINLDPIRRFRERDSYSDLKWVIYPDDTLKVFWDILIVMYCLLRIMFYTITVVPYRIAFPSMDSEFWRVFDLIIDSLFMIDVIINCFTAYYTNEDQIETSNKEIFLNYLKTWMIFDIVASVPFQEIFKGSSWNSVIKVGRLPRLYRLIKIAKIIRVIKNQHGFSNLSESIGLSLKIPLSLKRLVYFLTVFFLVCHLIACLWYFISTIEINKNRNWVNKYKVSDLNDFDLYICSMYWTVTTLTTVGYVDITPDNDLERGICICVMLGGVFFYSYTVGTITSIMSDNDKKQSKFESKLGILNDIAQNYKLSARLYKKIKSAIEYDTSRLNKETEEIINSLPRKLSIQLKFIINQVLVKQNRFFNSKPIPFINAILSHLKPFKFNNRENIFYQGQYSGEMYFVTKGQINLYKMQNKEMIQILVIEEGDYYGDVEIVLSICHEFGARAGRDTELMALSRDDFYIKVLNNSDDNFREKLIDQIHERRKMFMKKMEVAVTEYNITKKLSRSIANHDPKNSSESSIMRNNSQKNDTRLRKIRNTLSRKTITMLESARGDNEMDSVKKKLHSIEHFVGKLEERVIEYLRKKGRSEKEIIDMLGDILHHGETIEPSKDSADDEGYKMKISRFNGLSNRKRAGSDFDGSQGKIELRVYEKETLAVPVQIYNFIDGNHPESLSNIHSISKEKDLFLFSNIERQNYRRMTEKKDAKDDFVTNLSVKDFSLMVEDKDENFREIILELDKRIDEDDEEKFSKSKNSLSFVKSAEKSFNV